MALPTATVAVTWDYSERALTYAPALSVMEEMFTVAATEELYTS